MPQKLILSFALTAAVTGIAAGQEISAVALAAAGELPGDTGGVARRLAPLAAARGERRADPSPAVAARAEPAVGTAASAPGARAPSAAERRDEGETAADSRTPYPRTRTTPNVGVETLDPPYRGGLFQPRELELPPWSLFDERSLYETPPDVARVDPLPPFHVPEPEMSPFATAVDRLVRKKVFSEARRFMKRSWKEQFLATPTMAYASYIQGISRINQVGRDPQDFEFANTQHFANELKDDIFRRPSREGEQDFEVFGWGPLVVMDSGSVNFDLGRAVHLDLGLGSDERDELDPSPSVLATEEYRVSTSVKLGFDPLEALKSNDPTWIVDRYGLGVEVSWLSDVLGREIMTTEIEVEVERDGEFAALVNFIFRSRN